MQPDAQSHLLRGVSREALGDFAGAADDYARGLDLMAPGDGNRPAAEQALANARARAAKRN